MKTPGHALHVALAVVFVTGAAMAQDAVVPGEVRVDATFLNVGVVWWIGGDDDLDSTMVAEFRRLGDPTWRPAAPAMRAHPALIVNGAPLGLNSWAASALFLTAGTDYELRLTLGDPDGGGEVRVVEASTRQALPAFYSGRTMYVVPGAGGGTGTVGDPFRGLQAAADSAAAGDVFEVAPGNYAAFQVLASGTEAEPIVFLGPADGSAIVEGGGTDRGIVTLGEYDQAIEWVVVEGLTLQNGAWGVDAQHSRDIVIRHNRILDVDDGVVNRRGDGLEGRQVVCDNVIEGRVSWPGVGIPPERGIDLKGFGNVVCHNQVRNFGDCVSVQPSTAPSFGNDVYGNDASFCVDDGIEIDYNQANVRVWRNRVMNARMGVSVQPIRGGPAYILRNELFNLESVPIKMHNDTTGFFVVHNTAAKHGDGHGDNGAMWRYATFRNNVFLGTRYAFEFTTVADEGFRDLDFNGWGTTREQGNPSDPWFKWDNVRYDRLVDLQAVGVELHGMEAGFADLVNAALPAAWDQPVEPGSRDLRLAGNAPEIDAGTELPNLNDGFSLNGPPDLGALEYGVAAPHYGPRPRAQFADGFESGDTTAWSLTIP